MTRKIEVVNLRTCKDWGRMGDVRIDRKTKWGNPFHMVMESQRDEVCDNYEKYFELLEKVKKGLMECCVAEGTLVDLGLSAAAAIILIRDIMPSLDITELKGARRLGCWCAPKRCHGQYLKRRIEKL